MVSISKRMRALKALVTLRHGPGAAILPQYLNKPQHTSSSSSSSSPPPQPTLVRIRLDFPPGIGPASKGARAFWRIHLRRLKYHNPALPIIVNQLAQKGTPGNPGPAWRLFLDFEGEEKALRELASEPKNETFRQIMEEELKPRPRKSSEADLSVGKSQPQARSGRSAPAASVAPSSDDSQQQQQQYQHQHKHQQEASSQPSPQTALISTRTVSLPVLNRPAGALWYWFQQRTRCIDVPETEADRQLEIELAEQAVKGEEDRRRVKKTVDQLRAREQMLKLARREVVKMKADQ